MRAITLALLAMLAGCRGDDEVAPADLSSQAYFCPSSPPVGDEYTCVPSAIPYCTFPDLELTCRCIAVDGGRFALVCPADMAGAATD